MNKLYIPWALRIAAFPRPAPEPWFLFFMLFSIGAFFNISGKMRNRILLPLMYTCSSCATRPSLYVTVMLDIWKVKISQCSERPQLWHKASRPFKCTPCLLPRIFAFSPVYKLALSASSFLFSHMQTVLIRLFKYWLLGKRSDFNNHLPEVRIRPSWND